MKNKNGISPVMAVVWTLIIVAGVAAIVWAAVAATGGSLSLVGGVDSITEYEGEFDDVALPEEVAGTALAANTSYAEASEAFTVKFEASTNISVTAGLPYQFAYNFEVNGNMENLELDGDLATGIATTEMIFTKVYILEDVEGVALDAANAIQIGTVDTDNDKFELAMDEILDGDYVVVVEAKTIAPGTITDGEDLFTVSMDADSDDNDAVDEGVVTVVNAI